VHRAPIERARTERPCARVSLQVKHGQMGRNASFHGVKEMSETPIAQKKSVAFESRVNDRAKTNDSKSGNLGRRNGLERAKGSPFERMDLQRPCATMVGNDGRTRARALAACSVVVSAKDGSGVKIKRLLKGWETGGADAM